MNTEINLQLGFQEKILKKLGILLDLKTGHLFYDLNFNPLSLNIELMFVRHCETYGNCWQLLQKLK